MQVDNVNFDFMKIFTMLFFKFAARNITVKAQSLVLFYGMSAIAIYVTSLSFSALLDESDNN